MTLTQIKAMFAPGQIWEGKRTPGFNGEPATVTRREVFKVRSADLIFKIDGKEYYSTLPKASEVIEVRPGYLRYKLGKVQELVEVELIKELA